MKRIIKWTVPVVVLLLVIGSVVLYVNLNGIIERAVESQSTASLNLKTELDGANIALFGGKLSLDDLKIASPQGFAAPQMFTLDGADVAVQLGQLRKDPVRVESITLNRPVLVIESQGTTLNFKRAMELMPKAPEQPQGTELEPMKLIIDALTVKDATVVIRPGGINIPGLTLPEEITVPVPTINMKNVGTGEGARNGAAVKDVVMQVITVMAADAANSGKLPDQLKNLVNVNVGQVVAGLGKEAQKHITQALPGEAGKIVAGLLDDPNALLQNPEATLKRGLEQGVQQGINQLLPPGGAETGGPAAEPVDRAKQEAGKVINEGIKGLFDKKDDEKKKQRRREKTKETADPQATPPVSGDDGR